MYTNILFSCFRFLDIFIHIQGRYGEILLGDGTCFEFRPAECSSPQLYDWPWQVFQILPAEYHWSCTYRRLLIFGDSNFPKSSVRSFEFRHCISRH